MKTSLAISLSHIRSFLIHHVPTGEESTCIFFVFFSRFLGIGSNCLSLSYKSIACFALKASRLWPYFFNAVRLDFDAHRILLPQHSCTIYSSQDAKAMKLTFVEHYRLLKRMHDFIHRKGTGRYDDFAQRVGLSVSSLYRRLNELRALGAEIDYNPERQSFYYLNDFSF